MILMLSRPPKIRRRIGLQKGGNKSQGKRIGIMNFEMDFLMYGYSVCRIWRRIGTEVLA